MDITKFIQDFAEQFDDTDAGAFTAETKFRDLDEWSSIVALTVINMVIDEYGVQLKANDIINSNTIQDIFNIVQNRTK